MLIVHRHGPNDIFSYITPPSVIHSRPDDVGCRTIVNSHVPVIFTVRNNSDFSDMTERNDTNLTGFITKHNLTVCQEKIYPIDIGSIPDNLLIFD